MLADFFYGAGTELTGYMDMTLTVLSTIGILFILAGALQTANGNISGLEQFDHLTHKPKINLMQYQTTTKGTAKINRMPMVERTVSVISM